MQRKRERIIIEWYIEIQIFGIWNHPLRILSTKIERESIGTRNSYQRIQKGEERAIAHHKNESLYHVSGRVKGLLANMNIYTESNYETNL